MSTREITGTYGVFDKTESTIYIYEMRDGASWYVCHGSTNINRTYDTLEEGVDLESVNDHDTIQLLHGIESQEKLARVLER